MAVPRVEPVELIGVVGTGTMGAGIAQLALEAGHEVLIHDVDPAAIERGRGRIRAGLERRAMRLDLDPDTAEAWVDGRLSRLRAAARLDVLTDADPDLVIEAVLEDLAAKRAILRALDAATWAEAILATNTSALSVEAIARATVQPGRVLGLHFFNPAPVMPLVEVVVAPATDPAVAERATELMIAWGKVTVRCADTPGFIVNRVNRPFTLEALAMLAAGDGSVVSIDEAVRAGGYPMGPFELMDLVGIDINLAAAMGIFERARSARDPLAERFRPSPIQERLVAGGRLGRKTGEGFYRYAPDGQAIGPASGLARGSGAPPMTTASVSPTSADQPQPAAVAIAERITLAIVNEAFRALGEGVATAADIDLALRLGAGHPVGPIERAAGLGGTGGVVTSLRRYATHGQRFEPAPALLAGGPEVGGRIGDTPG
jgi:3-hydroxybutyryl-CoA dehydrogenase